MKKFICTLLAVLMLVSACPVSFAAEPETEITVEPSVTASAPAEAENDENEYDIFTFPVVNEVRDITDIKNDENEESAASTFSVMTAAETEADMISVSLAAQTAAKGDYLIVEDALAAVDETTVTAIETFYSSSCRDALITFTSGSDSKMTVYDSELFYSDSNGGYTFEIPVPSELANGTYTVTCGQPNSNGGSVKVTFELTITDMAVDNTDPLPRLVALEGEEMHGVEGTRMFEEIYYTPADISMFSGNKSMYGFAVSEKGDVYNLRGYYEENYGVCLYEAYIRELPVGEYACYLYGSFYNEAEGGYEYIMFGPVTVHVDTVGFEDSFFIAGSSSVSTYVYISDSYGALPENVDDMTVNMTVKDADKNELASVYDIETGDWYAEDSYDRFYLRFNLATFDAGDYYADITLCDGDTEYYLGEVAFTLSDSPVLEWMSLLNGSQLAPATKSFTVQAEFEGLFAELDKLDMSLVDSEGNEVAKTVGKGIEEVLSNYSCVLFDLEVTGTLDADESYDIVVKADKSLGLICTDQLNVYVTTKPIVTKAEINGDVVTVYTENLAPGTYFAEDTDLVDVYYPVVIDAYGVGTFSVSDFGEDDYRMYFWLQDTMDSECTFSEWFSVRRDYEDRFACTPDFLSTATADVEGFYFEIACPSSVGAIAVKDIPNLISYAQIVQNDTVVADIENLVGKGWGSYYDGTYVAYLEGDISVRLGAKLSEGTAAVVVGYNSGFVGRGSIDVVDADGGIYGSLSVDGWAEHETAWTQDFYVDYLIPTTTASFTLSGTNITEGTVALYCNGAPVEELDLGDLTVSEEYGFIYTYTGTFETEIAADCYYEIVVTSGDHEKRTQYFAYSTEKLFNYISVSRVIPSSDKKMYVWCYDPFNISAPDNVTFVANSNGTEYNLAKTTEAYVDSDGDIRYYLDISSLPGGYFTLDAYDGETKIGTTRSWVQYKVPSDDTNTYIRGTTSFMANGIRVEGLSGINLDGAVITAKLFRETELLNSEAYVYYDDIAVDTTTASKGYVLANADEFAAIKPGAYYIVWYIDGKSVDANGFVVDGAVEYDASVVLNGGNSYVTGNTVNAAIEYVGYTKMRYAFTEEELATAAYEAIASVKTITLDDTDGTHAIYFQFADSTEENVSRVIRATVTVDKSAPVVENVENPYIPLWGRDWFAFEVDEMLRSAYLMVGESDGAKVSGRQYVFSFAGTDTSSGTTKYLYEFELYADSSYKGVDNFSCQVVAIDYAGNATYSDIDTLHIVQPRDITGTVTDENGNGVANTVVVLEKDGAAYRTAKTDSDGVYEILSISPAEYTVVVDKKNYESGEATVAETDFDNAVIEKDVQIISLYSQTTDVKVYVMTAEDAAIEGAKVTLTCSTLGISLTSATVDNNDGAGVATFNVPYNTDGLDYVATVSYEGYTESQEVWVDGDGCYGKFRLPERVVLEGTVVSGDGYVKGEKVAVSGDGFMTYATTDDDGKFEVPVYIIGENRDFTVEIVFTDAYAGATTVTIAENAIAQTVRLRVVGNIAFAGTIRDKSTEMAITAFENLYFSGNGVYEQISVDQRTGEFKTPAIFGVGTYRIYGYAGRYENLDVTVTVTEEDLATPIKTVDILADKLYEAAEFTTGANGIAASADSVTAGETVNISLKFQNDGSDALGEVTAYTILPEGVTCVEGSTVGTIGTSGTQDKVSLTVDALAMDEVKTLTFTIDTTDVTDTMISIPAYVVAGGTTYTIGAAIIEVVNVTLDAPELAKAGDSFKVSGTAPDGSTVEILDADTKEVLAATVVDGKWYFTDIAGQSATVNLVAKVTKEAKVAYSDISTVTVEAAPISVEDCVIRHNNMDMYNSNEYFGYPTFSSTVDNTLSGSVIKIAAKFANMPDGAVVTYKFLNKTVKAVLSDDGTYVGYYEGNLMGWRGSGTKKITATVTAGETEYSFTLAEVVILIDPSGYITDAETGEPIVGATVMIEYWDETEGAWKFWDAAPSKQQNPMLTDETGHYGWVVPEGKYRVIVTMDGYETAIVERYDSEEFGEDSEIIIPPARTDVHIQLTNSRPMELNDAATAAISGGRIAFEFTRAVDPASLSTSSLKVADSDGNTIGGTLQLTDNNRVVVFTPSKALEEGEYKLTLSNIADLGANIIASEIKTFSVEEVLDALTAPTVELGDDSRVTITFTAAPENVDEIKVYDSDNNEVDGTVSVSEDGLTVTFAPAAAFDEDERYYLVLPETLHTADDKYLAEIITKLLGAILGDLTEDDALKTNDVLALIKLVMSGVYNSNGDMDDNGSLQTKDILALIKLVMES